MVLTCQDTGERVVIRNWREHVMDVCAKNLREAVSLTEFIGFVPHIHYNDIVKKVGEVED